MADINNETYKKPKIITYYLPQYHEVPENNEWWGEGFTEWTNVRKAKPFYPGQTQPKIPLNENYYNLMEKETVEWQTELAKKYGIYGFCYFHYYFKNGRKILEKPAENLLKWKDIDQNFCFFWANSEWKRTWSNANGPTTNWVPDDMEKEKNGTGILLEQDYGKEDIWEDHFNYLLPFFQDKRYIKIDNKPLFAVYHVNIIKDAKEMFGLWNKMAVESGFSGIYILSVNQACESNPYVSGILHYGMGMVAHSIEYRMVDKIRQIVNAISRRIIGRDSIYNVWDYKKYWKRVLQDNPYGKIQNFPGGTVRYDETPRRGEKSLYIRGDTPALFEQYIREQMIRGQKIFKTEYLFLDAWNEWGEGNYLEPDTIYGYGYLKALKRALDNI